MAAHPDFFFEYVESKRKSVDPTFPADLWQLYLAVQLLVEMGFSEDAAFRLLSHLTIYSNEIGEWIKDVEANGVYVTETKNLFKKYKNKIKANMAALLDLCKPLRSAGSSFFVLSM